MTLNMSKYRRQKDGKVEVGLIALGCCDCGLVHKMGFTMGKDGRIHIDFERDNRATAQLRRGKFPYLKTPQKGDKWRLVKTGE